MEFFGIGGPEFIIILVIAILLLGPDKIPPMAQQVGKAIRDFRRYTSDLTKEFNDATGGLRDEFTNITSDIRNEIAATQADLRSQLDLTSLLNPDITTSTATVAAATTATEPLTEIHAAPTAITDAPVATFESAPEPAITVMTPYAESLAAESANGAVAEPSVVETNGVAHTLRVATKADPFADLAGLIVEQPANGSVQVIEAVAPVTAEPVGVIADSASVPVDTFGDSELAPMIHTNGKAKVVGGSVAGSKYTRRKSA